MAWDDSDDDWEAEDIGDKLKLPAKEEEQWSDEEGHDSMAGAEEKPAIKPATPAPPKPKSALELKIEAREKREAEEAAQKEAIRATMDAAMDVSTEGMDPATAEKIRRQKMEEAASMDAAIDAFGLGGISDAPKPAAAAAKPADAAASKRPRRGRG